jgi:hypothetical protein
MNYRIVPTALLALIFMVAAARAAEKKEKGPPPQTFTHRVTGLFQPDRVDDLREAMKDHPTVKLLDVDYEHATATFSYDPKLASAEGIGNFLGSVGLGINRAASTPEDKLTRVEIGVVGLDCKGCGLGTYWTVYKLDGVERATVSYKEGLVVAMIDATKTSKAALEEAMRKRYVTLREPAKAAGK